MVKVTSTPLTGKERVKLDLSLDEVSFIVAGLRDLADQHLANIVRSSTQEEMDDWGKSSHENAVLARRLELAMLEQA